MDSFSGFVLTSNRDEAPGRQTLPPQVYTENGFRMVYPKDVQGGGTWLGVGENRRLISLLNGGFRKHQRKPSYRLSRGVIVKDILKAADSSEAVEIYDLFEVEPFTMVIVDWSNDFVATEVVWDGEKKHVKKLPQKPLLWSSSPLYSEEIKNEREEWFRKFFEQKEINEDNLLDFHFSAGKGDLQNGVIMDRGIVKTRSVSQVVVSEEKIRFLYKDLDSGSLQNRTFDFGLSELI